MRSSPAESTGAVALMSPESSAAPPTLPSPTNIAAPTEIVSLDGPSFEHGLSEEPHSFSYIDEDHSFRSQVTIGKSNSGKIESLSIEGSLASESGSIEHNAQYRFGWPNGAMREVTYRELAPALADLESPVTFERGLARIRTLTSQGFIYEIHPHFIDPDLFPEISDKLKGPDDREALSDLLDAFGVEHRAWGHGSKTIDHLLEELQSGESKLGRDEQGLFVATTVARVDIYHCDKDGTWLHLEESFQRLHPEGEQPSILERQLEVTLGEKMYPYESGYEAAIRGMGEELSISGGLERTTGVLNAAETSSSAYPGLRLKRLFYDFCSVLDNEQYQANRVHQTETDKDGVSPLLYAYEEPGKDKTVYFAWVPATDKPLARLSAIAGEREILNDNAGSTAVSGPQRQNAA